MMKPNKKVLVLQHAEPEHLGRIADALIHQCIEFEYCRGDLGQPLPRNLDGYEGLIIMGGPQSVYEEDQYPFLKAEKDLARHAVEADLPVLGVCLGSQILAEVLGSSVHPGDTFEVGWKKLTRTDEEHSDPILDHLPREFTPLHWHGDIYDLPQGARPIGYSELTPVQGYSWKERCYGLLFHIEISVDQIASMINAFPNDLIRGGITPDQIMSEAQDRVNALKEPSLELFRRWAALV